MTEDEMKGMMDFILERQAQITVTMGSLSEKTDRNTEGIAGLLAITEIQAAEIRDLAESTRDLRESTKTLADRQREADDRGRRTDERLNALINIVERHVSEGHNGKTEGQRQLTSSQREQGANSVLFILGHFK